MLMAFKVLSFPLPPEKKKAKLGVCRPKSEREREVRCPRIFPIGQFLLKGESRLASNHLVKIVYASDAAEARLSAKRETKARPLAHIVLTDAKILTSEE